MHENSSLWPSGHLWYCIPIVARVADHKSSPVWHLSSSSEDELEAKGKNDPNSPHKKHQCAVSSLRLDFLKLQPQTWGVYFCFLKHCSLEFFTHVFMCYLHFQVWHCAFLYYSTESFKSLKLRCGHQFNGLEPIFVPRQCSVSHLPANQEQDCLSPCLFSSFLYRVRLSQAYRQLSFDITLICFLM